MFNLQRTATLVQAVHLQDAALVRAVIDDRLHQPFRASLVPGLEEALAWQGEGLLAVFLSGAGPSIAAIVDARLDGAATRAEARFAALYRRLGIDVTVRQLHAHPLIPTPLSAPPVTSTA